jgi:hypothetical protein
MNTKLVFWTAFNSYQSPKLLRGRRDGAVHPVRTPEWTKRRVELFTRFNLPSILCQAHEDFLYVVLLDPKLRQLTEPILPAAVDPRIIYCYEDGPILAQLREYDELVLALIDSDDMYAKTAGASMMACPAPWMYFKIGYAYDNKAGKLFNYSTIKTGPFFARRINPRNLPRFDRDKRNPTHVAVADHKPCELAPRQFCVVIHDRNTSSHSAMRHILKNQGICDLDILKSEFGCQREIR